MKLNALTRYVQLRQGLTSEKGKLEARLAAINRALAGQTQSKAAKPVKKRRMSAAGRRRISLAAKKRWAAARAAGKNKL